MHPKPLGNDFDRSALGVLQKDFALRLLIQAGLAHRLHPLAQSGSRITRGTAYIFRNSRIAIMTKVWQPAAGKSGKLVARCGGGQIVGKQFGGFTGTVIDPDMCPVNYVSGGEVKVTLDGIVYLLTWVDTQGEQRLVAHQAMTLTTATSLRDSFDRQVMERMRMQ